MPKLVRWAAFVGAILLVGCAGPARQAKLSIPFPPTYENQQVEATHVQDWDEMASTVADGLQEHGLLPSEQAPAPRPIFVHSFQNSVFIHEFSGALSADIVRRHGILASSPFGADVVNLTVEIVPWGSRLRSEPYRVRCEAVWRARFRDVRGNPVVLQHPFYIFASDVPLYADRSDVAHPRARVLRYSKN